MFGALRKEPADHSPDMNMSLARNLQSILVELLNEADQVPQEVMDVIFTQFQDYTTAVSYPRAV